MNAELIETVCMIFSICLVLGLHFAIMAGILNNLNDIATALKEWNKNEKGKHDEQD